MTTITQPIAQVSLSQYIANLESTLQGFINAINDHYRNTEPFCEADEEALEAARALLDSKPLEHVDNKAVVAIADLMISKLAKQRAKGYGGWDVRSQCSQEHLVKLLRDHVEKGDPVDVANFCAMLSFREERIS